MKFQFAVAAALILAAGSVTSAQSLSTGFGGSTIVSTTAANTGNMFDVTALNPGGITINSFDIHSREAAGVQIDVDVYYIPMSFVGFNTDPSAWTLLGTASTTTAGAGQPTPLPVGGLTIPAGQTYGIYVNIQTAGASVRYYNATQLSTMTDPVNDDLRIHIVDYGHSVSGLFGSVFSPRGWNGTIYYTAHGTVVQGACCLPDGTCELRGEIDCANAEGTYRGDNTECATQPPCPQPGACCLVEGGCDILSEGQCAGINGTYHAHGSLCAAANCPGGACCLPDGSCVFTVNALCTSEYNGTYWGDGSTCGDQRCAMLPVLWNNGPLVTAAGLACNGGDLSELETALGTTILGFSFSRPNFGLADDFTVPAGETWTLEQATFWGYQTDALMVTITNIGVQIWDGPPGAPGSSVVAGDISANCLNTATLTNIFRASTANMFECRRQLQEVVCDLPATLSAGTYWIEATVVGDSAFGGPFMPPVKFLGRATKPFPNALQRTSTGWGDLSEPQELPFLLHGSVGSGCYADCDGNNQLTIDDFICFLNAFAGQDPYADCNNDGQLTIDDFICFLNLFAQGCP
jgi:hypothetical protein